MPSERIYAGQRPGRRASWPVGRVLCTRFRGPAVIHLGLPLPAASCGLPADSGGPPSIVRAGVAPLPRHPRPPDLAPGGVYRAVAVTCGAGGLLHHRFTLTAEPGGPDTGGGLFSVALSRGSPRVGVTDHPALRSPDLPRRPRHTGTDATARPTRPSLPAIVSPARTNHAPQRLLRRPGRPCRCAVSFSVRSTAEPLSKQSMWHNEATSRFILNIASGGASSARHTSVLIGVT
jgi:hypothetical protein